MQSGETVLLAGHRFFNHPIKDVTMNFRTESNELFKVNLQTIGSLIPTKTDRNTMNEIKAIPSIIGTGFLEDQKLALYFNPSTRVVYLEG
jgi:hypothetical protein